MVISRKLANKAHNRLQLILSSIQTGDSSAAIREIHELAKLFNQHIESASQEKARIAARDEDEGSF